MFGITRLNTLSARPQVLATLGSIAITSTQNNNGSTNMTIPTGETGSLMVLFNTAQNNTTTAPTAPSWSGFTNIINTATTTSNPGARTYIAYKVLTATDTNGLTQLTMMTGTGFAPSQNSFYLIIRGYTGANSTGSAFPLTSSTITISSIASQVVPTTPSSQTLTMSAPLTGPFIGFAWWATGGTLTNRGSSVTGTQTEANDTYYTYLNTYQSLNTGTNSINANSTISYTSSVSGWYASLQNFVIKVS